MTNTVAGNYIGVDDTGNRPLKNNGSGVVIVNGAGLDNVGDPANPLEREVPTNPLEREVPTVETYGCQTFDAQRLRPPVHRRSTKQ